MQKVGDYYASGMNEKEIDAAKAKPLADEFKHIDEIKDRDGVLKEIAHLHNIGMNAFFGFTSGQDDKNSTMVIAQAFQGGLGMPDRDYYTKEDDASKKLRDAIRRARDENADAPRRNRRTAAAITRKQMMALETSLAHGVPHTRRAARSAEELQQDDAGRTAEAHAGLEVGGLFQRDQFGSPGDINVGQPDFFKAANGVFQTLRSTIGRHICAGN